VVAETTLLLLASAPVVMDTPDEALRASHATLVQALIPHARSPRVRAAICLRPALASELGFAHSFLEQMGHHDESFEELMEAARRSESWPSRERTPHRAMEQEWIARVTRRSHTQSPHLARSSMLGLGLDALASSRDDIYAFTHAVMYATDFGARQPRLPRGWPATRADAEAALAWGLDVEDYDVTGEILLTWPLLRRPWSSAGAFGFRVLADVEDHAGFLPPPGMQADAYARLTGAERSAQVLADAYHTAYVMGLMSAVALLPGQAPPVEVRPTRHRARASADLLELLDAVGPEREAHWRSTVRSLTEDQCDELSPLLLTICLRRAATARDLGMMHSALQIAADDDLLGAPAPRQAAELLGRAARLALDPT
jgi:hypothetical protein